MEELTEEKKQELINALSELNLEELEDLLKEVEDAIKEVSTETEQNNQSEN